MMMVGWMTYAQNDVVLMTKTELFINLGIWYPWNEKRTFLGSYRSMEVK